MLIWAAIWAPLSILWAQKERKSFLKKMQKSSIDWELYIFWIMQNYKNEHLFCTFLRAQKERSIFSRAQKERRRFTLELARAPLTVQKMSAYMSAAHHLRERRSCKRSFFELWAALSLALTKIFRALFVLSKIFCAHFTHLKKAQHCGNISNFM